MRSSMVCEYKCYTVEEYTDLSECCSENCDRDPPHDTGITPVDHILEEAKVLTLHQHNHMPSLEYLFGSYHLSYPKHRMADKPLPTQACQERHTWSREGGQILWERESPYFNKHIDRSDLHSYWCHQQLQHECHLGVPLPFIPAEERRGCPDKSG